MSSPTSQNGSTRAADTDRIQVAQILTDAAAAGRLPMSEYENRLTKAYAAKTYDELERLSSDLPGALTSAVRGGPLHPAPSTVLLAIMSGFERRGRWNVPRKLTTFALGRRRCRSALRRLHVTRGRDAHLLDHGRPDDSCAAGGQRRVARPRRDGHLRSSRERAGH